MQPEQIKTGVGGQEEPVLPELQAAIVSSDAQRCEITAPKNEGGYRVFAYANNGVGSSVANVPFHVHLQDESVSPGKAATLPSDKDWGVTLWPHRSPDLGQLVP